MVRTLLHRCLVKDRKQRLQAIGEARIVLAAANQGDVERLATVLREYQIPYRLGSRFTHASNATVLEEAERDHILKTLEQTRWVVAGPSGAAARLGIKRSTLYFRMQKLGISRPSRDALPA